jgi:nucleoside 2-deoxyribosyltransferase
MPNVFLSHSARDAKVAAAIRRELRKHGVEAFDVSEDGAPAKYDRQAIKAAIRRADGLVLVIGAPEAASTSWATYELGMAEALGKPILTILSHRHAASELPPDLAGLPMAAFDPARAELAAREVVDRLLAAA